MRISRALSLSLIALAVSASFSQPVFAQNAAALKKAFEGREVTVLLDMPASHKGVDLYLQQEPEINFADYAERTKDFGVSLRKEDRVMVTLIKVNKKNIEIHLGGGGYGTFGDDSGYVSPTYVGKSSREREQRANQREAEALSAIKKSEVASKRLDGGSRFNIWYADKRLEQWTPTPEELMYSLAKYLDFGDGRNGDGVPGLSRGAPARLNLADNGRNQAPQDVETAALSLRRGQSTDDVHDLLGRPTRRRSSKQGDLEAVIETWETTDSVTEVTFVGGVVVKFTSSSK